MVGRITRRRFLHGTATASLVGVSACAVTPSYRGPVSGGPRLAVLGLRVQGRRHLKALLRRDDIDVTAVCDPDPRVLGYAVSLAARHGRSLLVFADPRELLESSEVDVVVIATPDHWHCLLTVWACQAGKHVYVESPPSHSIEEGVWMLEAAQRLGRSVRVAMPLRSHLGIRRGVAFLDRGGLGRLIGVRAFCFLTRPSLGRSTGPCALPVGLDFDLWAGPAPLELPHRRILHGDWRFDWRTGNGDVGEWGLHILDLARWIARGEGFPDRIWSCGGRFGGEDDGETPNSILAGIDYLTMPLVYEACSLPAVFDRRRPAQPARMGVLVTGSKGQMVFDAEVGFSRATGVDGELLAEFGGAGDPLGEFIEDLLANRLRHEALQSALQSTALVRHLNIAHRSGTSCSRTDVLRDLVDAGPVLDGFFRWDEHLARGGLEFDECGAVCSGWRHLDPETGASSHSPLTEELRTRTYRAPFRLTSIPRSV